MRRGNGVIESVDDDERTCSRSCLGCLKNNVITFLMIIFMAIGITIGVVLQLHYDLTKRQLFYLGYPGTLLLKMLKMMIIPLIVSSIVTGTAQLSGSGSGRVGGRAIAYYLSTTLIAVILGIILVLTIRPGNRTDEQNTTGEGRYVNIADSLLDLLSNCFPINLVTACFEKGYTEQRPRQVINMVNSTYNETITEYDPIPGIKGGSNILGLVVFSAVFGSIIGRMGQDGKPMVDFFDSLFKAIMRVVMLIIWYAPIGVCFLIASKLAGSKDLGSLMMKVGMYMATVLAGLGIHGLIILPLTFLIFVRRNPFIYLYNMLDALLMAFGTASSSATFPVTVRCLIQKNKVDSRIVGAVVPIGTTINMDGTALYEAVAAIFIAQLEGISLNVAEVIIVSLTSTMASIGAAGIPEAGLVTMAMVLTAVGLPLESQAVILTIDWFLDRCRTTVNVWGDSVGAAVVEAFSKKEIELMNEKAEEEAKSKGLENGAFELNTNF